MLKTIFIFRIRIPTFHGAFGFYNALDDNNFFLNLKILPILFFAGPPSPPEISGLPQNQTLREGQGLSLSCASLDGSPRPHLAWYVGESTQELSHSNFTLNPFSQSQLRLKASREDNNREYR